MNEREKRTRNAIYSLSRKFLLYYGEDVLRQESSGVCHDNQKRHCHHQLHVIPCALVGQFSNKDYETILAGAGLNRVPLLNTTEHERGSYRINRL